MSSRTKAWICDMDFKTKQVSLESINHFYCSLAQNFNWSPYIKLTISLISGFLKMYGFKFSKEDHVALINLLLSVIHIPDLEPWLVNKTASILVSLMKRKELLDRNDLLIEWKPLYLLFDRLMYSSYEALGMISFPP